jgi:hypothetical protein
MVGYYYQAHILREQTWFFTAALRSLEHMAFDRTIDKEQSLLEFFVPGAMHEQFVAFMADMQQRGLVLSIQQLPNRLQSVDANV